MRLRRAAIRAKRATEMVIMCAYSFLLESDQDFSGITKMRRYVYRKKTLYVRVIERMFARNWSRKARPRLIVNIDLFPFPLRTTKASMVIKKPYILTNRATRYIRLLLGYFRLE